MPCPMLPKSNELTGAPILRASKKPLPHVNKEIQQGWEDLCNAPRQRASQRPLPHVNNDIQKSWDDLCSEAKRETVVPPMSATIGGFDLESFRHFSPLLKASQNYASQSGFRFRSGSFDGLDDLANTLSKVTGPAAETGHIAKALEQDANSGSRLAAKINAAPAIKNFGERLVRREPELVEELEKAFRIVVAESARNMMVATVKGLGLFPPQPPIEGVDADDCSYEDASAPLPVIAQRLFNDQSRRQRDEGGSGMLQQRRAMTAAFLVDFAHHAGATLPESPDTYQFLLQEFAARNAEHMEKEATRQRAAAEFEAAERQADRKARGLPIHQEGEVLSEKHASLVAPMTPEAIQGGWLQRWQTSLWSTAGSAILGEAWKPEKRFGPSQGYA